MLRYIVSSYMSRFVAKQLQPRQKAWNSATQNRLASTSIMLGSMKNVKMLGIQHNLSRRIGGLRESELFVASKLRWIMVYYNASGGFSQVLKIPIVSGFHFDIFIANAVGIFSPAITLVIFALISLARGSNLDTETAFTTTAILSMVTHPANMIMTIMPRVVAALAGFERIQAFLLQHSPKARRGTLPKRSLSESSSALTNAFPIIQIDQLNIGSEHALLENIHIKVHTESFTVISGQTGSGKSTLLRTILGEVVPTHGSVSLSTRKVAYCAQQPWLPSGTIREAIYGFTKMSGADNQAVERFYQEVSEICCLTHDFNSLPDSDRTQIGSRGLNLSGGQRQRVVFCPYI